MTVEQAIHAWVVAGSGIAADRVLWANQTNVARPASAPPGSPPLAWISLNILADESYGRDWTTSAPNPLAVGPLVVSAIDVGANTLTIAGHGLVTGDGPLRPTATGTLPGGLAGDSWVIVIDADTLQLAASFLAAIETPAPIDLLDVGVGTLSLAAIAPTAGDLGTVRAGAEITRTTHGVRTMTLSIQCFGGEALGLSSSAGILRRLKASRALPGQQARLASGGVGLGLFGGVQDVSGVLRTGVFEPRAVAQVRFHVAAQELSENGTVIETTAATGTVT